MKSLLKKVKALIFREKTLPWYKRCFKKSAFMLDMKRRNKFITFFALLFLAVYFCLPSMDVIVKKIVHKYGSEITGTDVNLKKIKVRLNSGEGIVKGISIANPKGYKSKNLFSVNEVAVRVNISSLTSDTIVIDEIFIDEPIISYEMMSLNQNNVSDILKNVQSNTPKTEKTKNTTSAKEKSSKSGKNVIIKNLIVSNGQIEVMAGFGNIKQPIKLTLPTIKMQNIGQEKKGATISETISSVLHKILDSALHTVNVSSLEKIGGQTVDDLKEAGKLATKTGKDAVKNIKNLFN